MELIQLMSKEQMCKLYGCSMEQLNKGFKANAEGLQKMLNKAKLTGKKVNGYTESQLTAYVEKYNNLAK